MSEMSEDETTTMLKKNSHSKSRSTGLMVSLIITVILLIGVSVYSIVNVVQENNEKRAPKNVILMISDGFGPASETFARNYFQYKERKEVEYRFPLDTIQVGASRTRSSDSLVTDSAAGATAFSCAIKSYNGAIAVDDNQKPCATVLEAAQKKGMKSGLVVTSRITHATPAAFSSHVIQRDMEDEIAEQQLIVKVDLMMGGGKKHFMSSTRADGKDLIKTAQDIGYKVIGTKTELEALTGTQEDLPVLGLFADGHVDYEIDRNKEVQPSLPEMVIKALSILKDATRGSSKGFFLMIEGSRIDHAAHENDAAAHYYEIEEYQKAVQIVKDFVDSDGETVMISVSDHECGGLTVARQVTEEYPEYRWNPQALDGVKNSTYKLAASVIGFTGTDEEIRAYIDKVILQFLGIDDASQTEKDAIFQSKKEGNGEKVMYQLGELVNIRAELGWSTHGHSGVDVNLYAYGPLSDELRGNRENTEVGEFIIRALSLDLDQVELDEFDRWFTNKRSNYPKREEIPRDLEHIEERYHYRAQKKDL